MKVDVEADLRAALPRTQGPKPIAQVVMLLANQLKRSANLTYNSSLGLSSMAWTIIARLGAEGPMTQAEMADKYLMDKGQVSRTAVELAESGLIVRAKRDWRTIEMRLATKGRNVYASINKISRERHQTLTAGISERDLKTLYRVLQTVETNATALLNQLKD